MESRLDQYQADQDANTAGLLAMQKEETPVSDQGPLNGRDAANVSNHLDSTTNGPDCQMTRKTWADLDKEISELEWAWQDWMLSGFVTLIAAEVGIGKSQIALHIARVVMNGGLWPDGEHNLVEGEVLWCETEAAQSLNLSRAKSWGLDLNKLIAPSLPDDSQDCDFENPKHRAAIERDAGDSRIKLIIVDSLSGGHTRDENTSGMLQITRWLARLARETNKPILLVHHFNKVSTFDPSQPPSLGRVRGSTAIVQLVRTAWALDLPDVTNLEAIRMSVIKSNAAKFPKMLSLTISDKGLSFNPYSAPEESVGPGVQALRDITEFLGDGLKTTQEVRDWHDSIERPYSWRTLERAAKPAGYNMGHGKWGLPSRQ